MLTDKLWSQGSNTYNETFVFFFHQCSVLCFAGLFGGYILYTISFSIPLMTFYFTYVYTYIQYIHIYHIACHLSLPSTVSELFLFARLKSPYLHCKKCLRSVSYLTSLCAPMALSAPSALQVEAPAQSGVLRAGPAPDCLAVHKHPVTLSVFALLTLSVSLLFSKQWYLVLFLFL